MIETAEKRTGAGTKQAVTRRYPIGAELVCPDQTHFRVWAPKARRVDVVLKTEGGETAHPLKPEESGYFSGDVDCGAGALYKFRIDGGSSYADPASRYQPDGPHGFSSVIDPSTFQWHDQEWTGLRMTGQIIYEFHVGTFTPEGTWKAAAEKLEALKEIGVTTLEMMPIADFAGRFGWGYDGVNLFAPAHLYGTPDDLRAFVDRAHHLGLGVILDVVYNHFGPDGNYLSQFSDHYFRHDLPNDWGDTINFDQEHSGPVREFFTTNGRYWIDEFHFDGFRFDATQSIIDSSDEYIVGAIGRAARAAAGSKSLILVAENETQETKLVRPRREGGDDLDGLWNDDWHHSAIVALTGRNEAYYSDYTGLPQEFISAAKYGYLYQGQPYSWQGAPRGFPVRAIPPEAFISFLENHDQVSNSSFGERVRAQTSPGRYRAMTALLLLGPWTPLLFQGEEFGATTSFQYFTDVGDAKLKAAIRKGRHDFLAQFPSAATPDVRSRLPDPSAPKTFESSKLDWSEQKSNQPFYDLHRDLIKLRREDARLSRQIPGGVDGAVLPPGAFVLRFFSEDGLTDRLLAINLARRRDYVPASDPLLAPPDGCKWVAAWCSESPRYGGAGIGLIDTDDKWLLPAEAAVLFLPEKRTRPRPKPKTKK